MRCEKVSVLGKACEELGVFQCHDTMGGVTRVGIDTSVALYPAPQGGRYCPAHVGEYIYADMMKGGTSASMLVTYNP